MLLSAYEYTMVFRPGKANVCADALSRLPIKGEGTEEQKSEQVLMLDVLGNAPVDAFQIRRWTSRDVMMSRVREYILSGWPKVLDLELQPFHQRRMELSVRDGCALWGARVVVPVQRREMLLKLLHQTHTGISQMKGLARSYFWWPDMDKDVEREAQLCEVCQQYGKAPAMAPLHPWEWPTTPWSRIHVDYAGPFQGKMFLIVVDSHSKWMDVYPTTTATSQTTIEKLRQSFSVFGLPRMLVSDNGPCFTSADFASFMKKNGIQHIRTAAPFHPSSNGLAERAVQTFKNGLKKMRGETLETRVSRLLFSYRITPQTTTGLSPSEMMMSRRLRSTFDLLLPDLATKVQRNR